MLQRKRLRTRGKKSLSHYFHEYKPGDRVAFVLDLAEKKGRFPTQFQGRTGTIEKKQGKALVVKFLDGKVIKRMVTNTSHLKPLK
jgi:ribosomal protein L21E